MRQPVAVGQGKTQAFGLETVPAQRSSWPEHLRVTGRLELNESSVAHVSSLVDGVIREVPVELGQTVKKGDVLAYVDSREVGEAKLQLVKDKLQLASAKRTSEWHSTIHENTTALLDVLREGRALDEIETAFEDRPVIRWVSTARYVAYSQFYFSISHWPVLSHCLSICSQP